MPGGFDPGSCATEGRMTDRSLGHIVGYLEEQLFLIGESWELVLRTQHETHKPALGVSAPCNG